MLRVPFRMRERVEHFCRFACPLRREVNVYRDFPITSSNAIPLPFLPASRVLILSEHFEKVVCGIWKADITCEDYRQALSKEIWLSKF